MGEMTAWSPRIITASWKTLLIRNQINSLKPWVLNGRVGGYFLYWGLWDLDTAVFPIHRRQWRLGYHSLCDCKPLLAFSFEFHSFKTEKHQIPEIFMRKKVLRWGHSVGGLPNSWSELMSDLETGSLSKEISRECHYLPKRNFTTNYSIIYLVIISKYDVEKKMRGASCLCVILWEVDPWNRKRLSHSKNSKEKHSFNKDNKNTTFCTT